ncbi:MAG: dephospho-CoA kinase [Eubacterium sp.]|nr:dephospho-CoA kinase [Eubacterium sp.]
MENIMYFIGITGGVGSGKSLVMDYLENRYDAYCLKTDLLARQLMDKGGMLYHEVIHLFGSGVLLQDGSLDRKKIAAAVFSDRNLLEQLNELTHPAVRREIIRIKEEERSRGRTFFFLESALALEEKYDEICDQLWYVYADKEVRRHRLMESRGYSDEKIEAIMANQMKEDAFRTNCSFLIDNSGSPEETKKQIDERISLLIKNQVP